MKNPPKVILSPVQPFKIDGIEISTFVDEQSRTWFSAPEVCDVLGFLNSRKAVSAHCVHDGVIKHKLLSDNGVVTLTYINSENLLNLHAVSLNAKMRIKPITRKPSCMRCPLMHGTRG